MAFTPSTRLRLCQREEYTCWVGEGLSYISQIGRRDFVSVLNVSLLGSGLEICLVLNLSLLESGHQFRCWVFRMGLLLTAGGYGSSSAVGVLASRLRVARAIWFSCSCWRPGCSLCGPGCRAALLGAWLGRSVLAAVPGCPGSVPSVSACFAALATPRGPVAGRPDLRGDLPSSGRSWRWGRPPPSRGVLIRI